MQLPKDWIKCWFWSRPYKERKRNPWRVNHRVYNPNAFKWLLKHIEPFHWNIFGHRVGVCEMAQWEYELLK